MRNINKNLYPTKWQYFISKFSEEEAVEEYYKFCRIFSEEKYILKYGEDLGKIKFLEKKNSFSKGLSLEKFIAKYGKEEGVKAYNNWKKRCATSLDNFILKYGEVDGYARFENFKKQVSIGTLKAISDVNNNYHKRRRSTSLSFFLEKTNGDLELAKILLKDRQTNDLSKFVKKYGEEIGKIKYQETNKKKAQTLDNYIIRYGPVIGPEKYEKYCYDSKKAKQSSAYIQKHGIEKFKQLCESKKNTLSNFIKRFGEVEGKIKYKKCYSKAKTAIYSKIALEFCKKVVESLNSFYKDFYYGEKEYMFFTGDPFCKIIMPDLYIKDINVCVEFYGNYWHRNPDIYKKGELNSDKIWEHDKKRINILENKYNAKTYIIWEKDYCEDKEGVIKKIVEKIIMENINE